jgi:hypothetical protein
MLSDTYDYFEKEKEIKQYAANEFKKIVMPLLAALYLPALYIVVCLF